MDERQDPGQQWQRREPRGDAIVKPWCIEMSMTISSGETGQASAKCFKNCRIQSLDRSNELKYKQKQKFSL